MRNTKLTPADRFKTDAINTHVKSARHTNAVELELLSRVSVFHKDHMDRKENEHSVLLKALSIAYLIMREYMPNVKFCQF